MTSLILQTVTRMLEPILLLYSLYLLFGGHHQPGGGFSGGLMAAAAIVLEVIAFGVGPARRMLRIAPHVLIGLGLLLALASGLVGPLAGRPLMTGQWVQLAVPGLGRVKLGTPLLFDVGVYLVVVAITTLAVFSLTERRQGLIAPRQGGR